MNTPLFYLRLNAQKHPYYQTLLLLVESLIPFFENQPTQRIILAERDPLQFLAYFSVITSTHHQLFLANPNWKLSEWKQIIDCIQPHQILGNCPQNKLLHLPKKSLDCAEASIMISTGGTSGKIRFTMHSWQTLMTSAQGFIHYFALENVNSFCVLPLYHVGGLMQFVRSLISGGDFIASSFESIKTESDNDFDPISYFISLVPTQLSYFLNQSKLTNWLSQFKTILLGGAPAWPDLLTQARKANLPLALTYGMTETASQIATLKPADFLAGINNCGQILPHAKVKINEIGTITLQASSLCLGYYPDYFQDRENFQTDDLGMVDEQGYLTILGRKNHKIISGGENIFPVEVEAVIRATKLVKDIVILGVPDVYWGEKVIGFYVPTSDEVTDNILKKSLMPKLSKYKQPKLWVKVLKIPRNEQGKVDYLALKNMIGNGL